MTTYESIESRMKFIKPVLKEKYHVSRIGFFGSFARGEQTEDSDIDILVEFSKPIGLEFIELKEYLEDTLGRGVDLVTVKALKQQMKEVVLNEVIYQ